MTKRYLSECVQDTRPNRPKSTRLNRHISPDSVTSSPRMDSPTGLASKQTAEERRAAEAIARYNEVNLLFSKQFLGIDVNAIASQPQNTPSLAAFSPQMRPGIGSSHPTFSSSEDDDCYDQDRELAFELNESMGLVRHPPTQPQPDSLPNVSTSPWIANIPTPPATSMSPPPSLPITAMDNMFTLSEGEDLESQQVPPALSSRAPIYPFTTPTAGELMVTSSPVDASYQRLPPRDTRVVGDAVEDLSWLGDQLQRNARAQLQELNGSGQNVPYVS